VSVEVPAPELIGSADGGDLPVKDHLLRRLLLEYHNNWERPEGWSPEEHSSAILFIATMVEFRSQGFPPGRIKNHFVLARQLRQRQLPGNPWEVYSDKQPERELLDVTRACASRGGNHARRWLTESLAAPAPPVHMWARRASPALVAPPGLMARRQGQHAKDAAAVPDAVVGAETGVVLEEEEKEEQEAEDDDDVPVTVDYADDEDQVDVLA
jgi:hypothetical protein